MRTQSVRGGELPNARFISLMLCNGNNNFDQFRTHLITFFGQFLDHDITATAPIIRGRPSH
jgi:hypothetical protein